MPQWRIELRKSAVIRVHIGHCGRTQHIYLESKYRKPNDTKIFLRFCNIIWHRGSYVYLRFSAYNKHDCGDIETLYAKKYRNPKGIPINWEPPINYTGLDIVIMCMKQNIGNITSERREKASKEVHSNKFQQSSAFRRRSALAYYDALTIWFRGCPLHIIPRYLDCKFEFTADDKTNESRYSDIVPTLGGSEISRGYEKYQDVTPHY